MSGVCAMRPGGRHAAVGSGGTGFEFGDAVFDFGELEDVLLDAGEIGEGAGAAKRGFEQPRFLNELREKVGKPVGAVGAGIGNRSQWIEAGVVAAAAPSGRIADGGVGGGVEVAVFAVQNGVGATGTTFGSHSLAYIGWI